MQRDRQGKASMGLYARSKDRKFWIRKPCDQHQAGADIGQEVRVLKHQGWSWRW